MNNHPYNYILYGIEKIDCDYTIDNIAYFTTYEDAEDYAIYSIEEKKIHLNTIDEPYEVEYFKFKTGSILNSYEDYMILKNTLPLNPELSKDIDNWKPSIR